MITCRLPILIGSLLALCACAAGPVQPDTAEWDAAEKQLGLLWVKHAAEYRALTLQAYAAAEESLERFRDDGSWSALPDQRNAESLPPAVIIDVDETLVSNVDFQLAFEPPFANWKLEAWNAAHVATPVAGAAEFVAAARGAGVTVFFVTNRPCEPIEGNADDCPQERTTLEDLRETGIPAEPDYLLLANEKPGWSREKLVRRALIAQTHRVIMLIGDDLGDFIPCVRSAIVAPCEGAATGASREALVRQYRDYWGAGWYILPNPMHGSWTSAE